MTQPILAVRSLRKSFGGVAALRGVDLALRPGEVHALLGENGAGKSTLVAACSGAVAPDHGEILLDGVPARFAGPHEASRSGIAVVHQEPALAPNLTVLENLLLPELAHAGWHRSWRPRRRRAEMAGSLREVGLDLDLDAKVADLSVSSRQMVEIAKALTLEPRVLFLDEPNSALSPAETTRLFDVVRRLCSSSAAVVLISHRISEVFSIADRATILRNGSSVWAGPIADTNPAQVIATISEGHQSVTDRPRSASLGRARTVTDATPAAQRSDGSDQPAGEPLLECRGLARSGEFEDVSLTVRAGEIVGVSGLVGAGRTELARCLFGLNRPDRGTIRRRGEPVRWSGPRDAIANGIALVPEDRAEQGVFPGMSVRWNMRAAAAGLRSNGSAPPTPEDLSDRLGIKAASLGDPISSLSGGNQQKAVIGRWLMTRPEVLILDEPTRGIDVGAKDQIYGIVRDLAAQGMGVLLISSEVEEIGELATRVVVMRRGRIAAEIPESTDVRSIMAASFGETA
ncbi:sugar ABC transporter ATP-binding protein [Pseudonocardia sp. MH-G8]|uniref:sugar ABC transporter ATP-binding protein n=1 Tax=Pseudonocardia sp. MH-G8 TaxID=1854588 RepID=UPI000BA1560B|nr:sugar ABC transporter ATP-binding protein [Pseudonocardia sp. MH-G8]OZM78986.1 D-xylose ABC transporter ATP-binding protein [Pseudonocardia sp. MH-G8]